MSENMDMTGIKVSADRFPGKLTAPGRLHQESSAAVYISVHLPLPLTLSLLSARWLLMFTGLQTIIPVKGIPKYLAFMGFGRLHAKY